MKFMPISDKIQHIPEALSIYFNQLVYELKKKQKDIIVLSLGEAFFDIPCFDFRPLDFNSGYHYSHSLGLPELREKIARYYCSHYNASIHLDNILISAGSKVVIYMCMQALINPNEEVLIHEPAWLSYQEQAKLVGAHPRFIPFDCPVTQFHRYFTEKTRMLILNNPNNPVGRVYTQSELSLLYQQCRKHGIYILMDEAYSDFVLDGSFYSLTNLVPSLDGVIIINSLSKNMGMSGWRIGYAISNKTVLNALLKLNQHLITCAPTILQLYLAKYFDEILSYTLPQVRLVVEKRNRVAKRMDNIGLRYLPGNSTFYFFVSTKPYAGNVHELALFLLLEKGVCVVPGSAYGKSTENFVRISIGAESEERIDIALQILYDHLHSPPIDFSQVIHTLSRLELPIFSEGKLIQESMALLP